MFRDDGDAVGGRAARRAAEVWDGFTRHAAGYLWPIAYEPRVGGAERGLTSAGGTVTVWDPPRHFRTEASRPDGWFNSLDYAHSTATTCATCTPARWYRPSSTSSTTRASSTRRFYYHSLGEYLRHFAGREPHYLGSTTRPARRAEVCARLGVPATPRRVTASSSA